jgi:hypothetical protein
MRKLIICAAIAAVMFGCKKDGAKKDTKPSEQLIGTWQLVSDSLDIYQNGNVVDHVYNAHTNSGEGNLTFNNDGTFKFSNTATYSGRLTWSKKDDQLTFIVPASTKNGYDSPGYTTTATIKKLNANQLDLYYKVNIETSGSTSIQHFAKQ